MQKFLILKRGALIHEGHVRAHKWEAAEILAVPISSTDIATFTLRPMPMTHSNRMQAVTAITCQIQAGPGGLQLGLQPRQLLLARACRAARRLRGRLCRRDARRRACQLLQQRRLLLLLWQ